MYLTTFEAPEVAVTPWRSQSWRTGGDRACRGVQRALCGVARLWELESQSVSTSRDAGACFAVFEEISGVHLLPECYAYVFDPLRSGHFRNCRHDADGTRWTLLDC